MASPAIPSRGDSGFTLIELLVAIVLLSLLALVLFGGLHFGMRAWEGANANSAGSDDLRIVQGIIRREIEGAYPYYQSSDPLHRQIDFRGDRLAMTFLATAPQASASSARSHVTIAEEHDRSGAQLTIRAVPELAVAGHAAWSASLVRDIATARFSFLGSDGWHDTWQNQSVLPSLVRVHVTFKSGDGRFWPDLIVAPHITADAGCVYDYATKRCQGRL